MAFAGVYAAASAGDATRGFWSNRISISGLTLSGRVGAFAVAAADSGRLTTDLTPPANNTSITPAAIVPPATVGPPPFGQGPGNWVAGDNFDLDVAIYPSDDAALVGGANAASDVRVVGSAIDLAGTGDLTIDFHNVGAGAFAGVIVINWTNTLAH